MYLNCHTYFSLRHGTLSVQELVDNAVTNGSKTIALTDINNTSAAMDFIRYAQLRKVKPIVGIEFRDENKLLFIGLAKNKKGFEELNRHLSKYLLNGEPIPPQAPAFRHAYIIYPFKAKETCKLRDNEYVGIRKSEANMLVTKRGHLSRHILLHPVTFGKGKQQFTLHRLLRAIDNNTLITKLTKEQHGHEDEYMCSNDALCSPFELYPEILRNTKEILSNCSIKVDLCSNKNRKTFTGTPDDDKDLLEKLAWDGYAYRYEKNSQAKQRIKKELSVIIDLGFAAYFLITWDILRYAQSRGANHVGRGSGANSIVAYCLGITNVDPIELDLYFERFINPHRTSPPDFDIDFSWDERDDVIDYIFKRYGKKYTGLIATYSTFQGKSNIRELGKVFGLPKQEIDLLICDRKNCLNKHKLASHIYRFAQMMEGFPNYLSIHAGGVIISEEPLNRYTALQMMPKGFPITHWDMHVAEDIGFYKYDILSQRGLGHIKEAVAIILKNKRERIDIDDVKRFKKDKKVREQLRSGNSIGCFYIESPAMRGLLRKLRCDKYLTLVAASSIIRPGVAQSGMMRTYIERFHNPESFEYLHPIMKEHLSETYGIMIYQEDVIKIAHHFAGVTLSDADILRRAMSGKYRSKKEMERITAAFLSGCKKKGHPSALIKEVWRQISSFSGYSFSKAHSASYAVESFQSLYLKAHHPLEFMVAVINNFGGFYRTETYVHEARMAGAKIEAPCVNRGQFMTSIKGSTIFLGFIHLKQLERKLAHRIIEERKASGPFNGLQDFIKQTEVTLGQLSILIRVGAFRFTKKKKKVLLWEAYFILNTAHTILGRNELFATEIKEHRLPPLQHTDLDDMLDEIELLGFPLCSPFSLLKSSFRGEVFTQDLIKHKGKTVKMIGYYIHSKTVRTIRGDLMKFACFTDYYGKFFDTIHFPQILEQYPFKGHGCYLMRGKVIEEFGFPMLEVNKMEKMQIKQRYDNKYQQ
ncbi:MAG TPA: DNA polymerase III subunit alpha [Flavobacteriales bacterium]|nr:DNA polymerase III subunit alpha [Flavobacteriales bacterium]HIN39461.1 DNA polymerase III subunit alpha [Flavobacteriales bacterium]